jgi:hypothetical protein
LIAINPGRIHRPEGNDRRSALRERTRL